MKKPSAKGGRQVLDDDESDLWSHTSQSIEPLKRRKQRVHPASQTGSGEPLPPRQKPVANTDKMPARAAVKAASTKYERAAVALKAAPPIADFDRKKIRKIRSGQVDIEARIDLHGLRQDEAHAALRAFLQRCLGKGQRWVLVITGKGKRAERDDDAPFDMTVRRDRGVLKRNVPMWLAEPDLRPMIVSFATAAIQHGGDGALYIHLRTKQR